MPVSHLSILFSQYSFTNFRAACLIFNTQCIIMEDSNDLSLVNQVTVLHDTKAFDRIVMKYQSPIRRFFLHQTLGDVQLSDDLAQETFIRAYTRLATFRQLSSFSTWLFRIAYNVFYDHVRRERPVADMETAEVARKSAGSADECLRFDVYDALRRLGDKERACITLQLMDGYPIDKIADITGIAVGTVKSHLFRGKEKLTKFLKENGYGGK